MCAAVARVWQLRGMEGQVLRHRSALTAGHVLDPAWLEQIIDTTDLRPRLGHRPAELSGGQQQRVACARALAARPAVIFADEPTGNLDSRAAADMLTLLRRCVHELGQTIVMVTHDPVAAAHGLLRTLGMTRPQIRRLIHLEAVLVAVHGAVLGLGLGLIGGAVAQQALTAYGATTLTIPWTTNAAVLIGAVGIGLAAAVLPAQRAARLSPLEAITAS